MPWYSVNDSGYSDHPPKDSYYSKSICCPFKFGNVLYDYSNIDNMRVKFLYERPSRKYSYSLIISQSDNTNINYQPITYFDSSYNRSSNYAYSYFYMNREPLEPDPTIENVGTSHIDDGKYKCITLTSYRFSFFVLPFYSSCNGKAYKYWNTKYANNDNFLINESGIPSDSKLPLIGDKIAIGDIIEYKDVLGYGLPPEFVTWFNANFQRLYENTYNIKSITGETLDTLTEAPPMISATLSAVGNAKYLTLKDENNINHTMEWTSETPQGKIFVGLATSKGGSIVIPVGETSTINLTDSTDLYEVWQTYRPPTTTFEIKTYNYSGETSRVDKTDYLTPISTLSGVLRGESSLLNFNVLIQSDTVPNFNYCYIDKFKRYYYVTEPVSVRQNLWEMTMQVDALMTYKDSLLKCEGYIDRNEYIQNKMIIDNNRAIMQGADFEEDTITNELFGSGSFVLSGLRIGTKEK